MDPKGLNWSPGVRTVTGKKVKVLRNRPKGLEDM
jgi:hypothetical protein